MKIRSKSETRRKKPIVRDEALSDKKVTRNRRDTNKRDSEWADLDVDHYSRNALNQSQKMSNVDTSRVKKGQDFASTFEEEEDPDSVQFKRKMYRKTQTFTVPRSQAQYVGFVGSDPGTRALQAEM